MTRKATGKARLGEPTLTASDWAEAALQLIAEKGLGALTVSHLATRLGVTKGSFYWHFAGRPELLKAALARWEQQTTGASIQALDAVADHRTRLELIFGASTQPPRARSLYAALAQAAEDPIVRGALQRVAASRIDYLEVCYRGLGFTPDAAKAQAVFVYAAYRGLLQLAHEAPATLPANWTAYAEVVRAAMVPVSPAARPRRPARKG